MRSNATRCRRSGSGVRLGYRERSRQPHAGTVIASLAAPADAMTQSTGACRDGAGLRLRRRETHRRQPVHAQSISVGFQASSAAAERVRRRERVEQRRRRTVRPGPAGARLGAASRKSGEAEGDAFQSARFQPTAPNGRVPKSIEPARSVRPARQTSIMEWKRSGRSRVRNAPRCQLPSFASRCASRDTLRLAVFL
jgi:hypothetical protein